MLFFTCLDMRVQRIPQTFRKFRTQYLIGVKMVSDASPMLHRQQLLQYSLNMMKLKKINIYLRMGSLLLLKQIGILMTEFLGLRFHGMTQRIINIKSLYPLKNQHQFHFLFSQGRHLLRAEFQRFQILKYGVRKI